MEHLELSGPDRFVTRFLLQRNASREPDQTYVDFADGTSWTRRGALDEAARTANGLRALGVGQGHRVAFMLDNGPDFLRVLWGAAALGAVAVPINTALRGAALRHLLDLAQSCCVVVDPRLHSRFTDLQRAGELVADPMDVRTDDPRLPELTSGIADTDTALLMLTSGTTGASKLSRTTYLQNYLGGSYLLSDKGFTAEDTALVDLPMFHLAIGYKVTSCLVTGTRLAVRTAPDLENYWELARDAGANINVLLGSMMSYLTSRPSRPAARQHAIRLTMVAPAPREVHVYQERFAVAAVTTGYGSTELPVPLALTSRDDIASGTCGRPRAGFEAKIVDAYGVEVPDGTVGELLVRGELDPEAVFLHCAQVMPYFMVPRFVEVTAELPKTHTQRIQKYQLRRRGNGERTWDRATAGYRVSRQGLTRYGRPVRRPPD